MRSRTNTHQYNPFTFFALSHWRAFKISLSALKHYPISAAVAVMTIGITIGLPLMLYLLLKNGELITAQWNNKPTLSIYLKNNTTAAEVETLINTIHQQNDILRVEYISPEQGLHDFKRYAEFTDIVLLLKHNPLPPVINVTFATLEHSTQGVNALLDQLRESAPLDHLIDQTSVDTTWMVRLHSIILIAQRVVLAIACFLGTGAILAISNTIRLTAQKHHYETQILTLVGATRAYIRRPFLYRGLLYGLLGGSMAWILTKLALIWTTPPLVSLLETYGETAAFNQGNAWIGLIIIGGTSLLSVVGSWLVVRKQLLNRP